MMETILVLLIIATALCILAMCACGLWLHHKIGIFKEQQRRWAIIPSWESLEFALKAIRKFSDAHYPEGQPRLDMASFSLSQYMKQMRYLAAKEAAEARKNEE